MANKGSGVGLKNPFGENYSLLSSNRGLLQSNSPYMGGFKNPLDSRPTSLSNPNGGWLENNSPYMDPKNWGIDDPDDYVDGMNSAKAGMISMAADAAGKLTGAVVSGILEKKDNENARNEARELANIAREDTLKQQNIELSFRKKQIEQEEQQMRLQQMKETINQRFSIWRNKFQRELQNINKARQAAVEFKQKYMQLDEEKRQQMVRGMI
jgi:hypothetical protein